MSQSSSTAPNQAIPYELPDWAKESFAHPPEHGRLRLANLPTPLYRIFGHQHSESFSFTNNSENLKDRSSTSQSLSTFLTSLGASMYVKRDDCTGGVELGGNKCRKLEFLLADALAHNHNAVVTIGGLQSNHCRATAAASRMVGLEPHLILRTTKNKDLDREKINTELTGNILMDRILGSKLYTCTPGEYGRLGSDELVARLSRYIKQSSNGTTYPYSIPVGGSNAIGTWGYINAVDELMSQLQDINLPLDYIVFACGSGGTAAGISLGVALAFQALSRQSAALTIPKVMAVGVCDDPDYFYHHVASIADQMGLQNLSGGMSTEAFVRQNMNVFQGKGCGYAISTPEELEFAAHFARDTGIVLDPVYSGKALFAFVRLMEEDPACFRDKNILFWHTGGALGLYDKVPSLLPFLQEHKDVYALDAYGKGIGIDISQPSTGQEGRATP